MFTGIIKSVAPIAALEQKNDYLRYAIRFTPDFLFGLEKGASISVDGVCQTVSEIEDSLVWFEAIEETLTRTTISLLSINSLVNLERSAKIGDEIGGHLLSGHIFGKATIFKIEKNIYWFTCPFSWMRYFFSKGFIAIDGISLTLVDVYPNNMNKADFGSAATYSSAREKEKGLFSVHLIPETLKRTTLGFKKVNDQVNIELDTQTQACVETIERLLAKVDLNSKDTF